MEKPRLKLTGEDGNAYAILGAARRAAKKANWPDEQWKTVEGQAMSGDYDNLLQTMMQHFEVV